jgi:photoactive yellow protein
MTMKDSADFDAVLDDAGLKSLSSEEYDALPFGSIKLDRANRVTLYNRAETELARRDSADVLGKLFFEEVAPCTNNPMFRGRLEALVRDGVKSARFDYLFLFAWGSRPVRIQLWVPDAETRWIFVLPL